MSVEDTPPDAFRFDEEGAAVGSTLRRLRRTAGRDHRRLLAIGVATSVLYPLFAILPPALLQVAIDGVLLESTGPHGPILPRSSAPSGRIGRLWIVAGAVLGTAVAAASLSAIGTLAWGRFAHSVQHELRAETFVRLQDRELGFFATTQNGQLMSILSNDIDELDRLIQHGGKQAIETAIRLVGITAVLVVLHWQLAIVAFLVVPMVVLASRWYYQGIRPVYGAIRQALGSLNARLDNDLQGMLTIKAYGREAAEADSIARASRQVFHTKWHATVLRGVFFPLTGLLNAAGFVAVLVIGGYWIIEGPPGPFTKPVTVGTLVAFLLYNEQLREPLVEAGGVLDAGLEMYASLHRIAAVAGTPEPADGCDQIATAPDTGTLDVSDVSYAYEPDSEAVLSDISLHIADKSFVGIVGPTGSGKSTLAHILAGLLSPDTGRVRLDGTPIGRYAPAPLRRSIALVPQAPYLFTGTVAENVAYGRPDASRAAIREALSAAEAAAFVRDLDEGLDTTVGQGGVDLSGGQRQRLAIARAILMEPSVLILDEATSDVDARTEARLRETFRELARSHTVIAITHRLGTVRDADRLFVLEAGEVVERGTHTSLQRQGGPYAQLWAEETRQTARPESRTPASE